MNTFLPHRDWSAGSLFAMFLVGAAIIAGCSSGPGVGSGGTGGTAGTGSIVQSSLAHNTSPQASDADLAAVVAGNTTFALNVFPHLDTDPNKNTFFSPYSVTMAFALLAPGAAGTTLSEIDLAMSFPLAQDRLNPALNKLDLLLAGKTTGAVLWGLQTPILNNANAVWGQQGFTIRPAYLDTLAVNYGAGLHLVDFIHATEASRLTINDWVAGQTNNKIQNLIPQGGVSNKTRLVLTNAIRFKADWADQFAAEATMKSTFNNRDGSSSSVPFMSQRFSVPYAQADGCQAVDIPYAGDKLSMMVIVPTSGTFDTFLSALTPAVVADVTNKLTPKNISFSMPKFTFTKATEMSSILKSLGMVDLFDSARADLSGIDGQHDLSVTGVFHQAFISVDENGTEAAAATAIGGAGSAGPSLPDLTLTVDHSFIFLIRDRQTGLILFMGKVVTL